MTILERIYRIEQKWYLKAPYLATFLRRMTIVEANDFPYMDNVDTIMVGVFNKRIHLVYNEEWCSKYNDRQLEGLLYHEILHLIQLNMDRYQNHIKRRGLEKNNETHEIDNYASDAVNNAEILQTSIGGEQLELPHDGGVFIENIQKDYGYDGPLIQEDLFDFLWDNLPRQEQPQSFDDHRLLDENKDDEEAQEIVESTMKEAQDKSWGSCHGGGLIQIEAFRKRQPKVDPRKIIHNHVTNYLFTNHGKFHYTWTRRNRRGHPIPGKRRAEPNVYVFMDVSGSTFSQEVLQKFFNEIDYIAKRGVAIKLVTWDINIREELDYTQGLWNRHQFQGGGGTFAQPIFEYLYERNASGSPTLIFTDGIFDWNLESKGVKPFWVFSQNPFGGQDVSKALPFGRGVVLDDRK